MERDPDDDCELGLTRPRQFVDGDPPKEVDLDRLRAYHLGRLSVPDAIDVDHLVVFYRDWHEASGQVLTALLTEGLLPAPTWAESPGIDEAAQNSHSDDGRGTVSSDSPSTNPMGPPLSTFAATTLWWFVVSTSLTFWLQDASLTWLDRTFLSAHGVETLDACFLIGLIGFGAGLVFDQWRWSRRFPQPEEAMGGLFVGAALGLSVALGFTMGLELASSLYPIRPLGLSGAFQLFLGAGLLGGRWGLNAGAPLVRHIVGNDVTLARVVSNLVFVLLLALPLLLPWTPSSLAPSPLAAFVGTAKGQLLGSVLLVMAPIIGLWRIPPSRFSLRTPILGGLLHLAAAGAIYSLGVRFGVLAEEGQLFLRWLVAAASAGVSAFAIAQIVQKGLSRLRGTASEANGDSPSPWIYGLLFFVNAIWMFFELWNATAPAPTRRSPEGMWQLELALAFFPAWFLSLVKGWTWFRRSSIR